MVDPKTFYRDFDVLLQKIRRGKAGKGFVFSILKEVQNNFGQTLKFGKLRLYEERGDEFVLVEKLEDNGEYLVESIGKDSVAAELVLKHGSYIFDGNELSIDPEVASQDHYAIPAALMIRSSEQRWIAVVELVAGWVREEIIFSLNAIRTAISHRLISDAIQTGLEQAVQIQSSLLPSEVPDVPGYEIARRYQPTEIVGGDLYDFLPADDVFGVCIGDASGHGLAAALLVRDCVIGMRMGIERHLKMVHTFEKLNKVLYKSTYSSRFVSLFYGEIEQDGHLIYVNAGHPAPFIVHGDDIQDLKATGLILGAIPDMQLNRAFAHVPPNAVLVLYSDGIFERENLEEETFNINRLKALVKESQHCSAEEIVETIYQTVFDFGSRKKWEDDITIVVIKRIA